MTTNLPELIDSIYVYFFADIDFLKNKLENILRNETFQAIYKTLISQCLKITKNVSPKRKFCLHPLKISSPKSDKNDENKGLKSETFCTDFQTLWNL